MNFCKPIFQQDGIKVFEVILINDNREKSNCTGKHFLETDAFRPCLLLTFPPHKNHPIYSDIPAGQMGPLS